MAMCMVPVATNTDGFPKIIAALGKPRRRFYLIRLTRIKSGPTFIP